MNKCEWHEFRYLNRTRCMYCTSNAPESSTSSWCLNQYTNISRVLFLFDATVPLKSIATATRTVQLNQGKFKNARLSSHVNCCQIYVTWYKKWLFQNSHSLTDVIGTYTFRFHSWLASSRDKALLNHGCENSIPRHRAILKNSNLVQAVSVYPKKDLIILCHYPHQLPTLLSC